MSNSNKNKPKMMKRIIIGAAALVLLGLVFFLYQVFADPVIYVPGQFSYIQDAIDSASDGDVIIVEPGTYYESIDFGGKNITLSSIDPDDPEIVDSTIIDGLKRGTVVTFRNGEGPEAIIKGFTITGGSGTYEHLTGDFYDIEINNEGHYGGGIIIDNNSSPTISKNNIKANHVDKDGGGIAVLGDSKPLISENTIVANSAYSGGGVSVWFSDPVIEKNIIRGNNCHNTGAGISIDFQAAPLIDSNEVYGNSATLSGGGIAIWYSSPTITDNSIHTNRAIWFGGGVVVFDASPLIEGNDILRNRATNNGGGIAVAEEGSPVINNNRIARNFTDENGGGIAVIENSEPTITGNEIINNVVKAGGGGIFVNGASPVIEDNNVSANIVDQDGGGIAVINNSNPIVANNVINENTAIRLGGGMVIGNNSSPEVVGNSISFNMATTGGGVYVQESDFTFKDNTVEENLAEFGGGISIMINSNIKILNNIFEGNKALDMGGAIFAYDGVIVTLSQNEFLRNEGVKQAGIYVAVDATVDVPDPDDNIYIDNIPEDIEP